ncbi:hypothetical protein CC86DRAFT_384760 [Ophiobolus disseminans]|uniref:Uncharacterized protein n=1 Tax=Ophiobolus disseminans TaxID=1469910 RepID=A0A6A6ZRG4_9PLEO|nr:hypothetical protein CC86DRAFT_384760 [Ophiobolus disseminans]
MQYSTMFLALLGAATTLAAPMDHRLEDIQCRCLSFSTDAKPTVCTYMGAHKLDWHTATSLASDYDLKINFASQSTITKVLSINRPLPSSVLQTISDGEVMPVDSKDLLQKENKIVCGFGDEVKHMGDLNRDLEPECHFVGYVGAAFMLLIAFYVLAEYVWARFFSQGSIKLDGDEKALMADYDASLDAEENAAP